MSTGFKGSLLKLKPFIQKHFKFEKNWLKKDHLLIKRI